METVRVSVPNDWHPRDYQRPLWNALSGGTKRAVAVWHRRAGKDAVALNWAVKASVKRVGTYWHMLPTLRQGRLVIWDGITKDGRKVLDHWPEDLIAHRRNDEMKLTLHNGSAWHVVGSDNYNSLVGSNPVGVVFSEYALADPAAWDFIRPILAENNGWALFIYTPRGRNHGYELYNMAERNPEWFCERLGVEDTQAINISAVEEERQAGMSEEMIQQEFYCSFDAPLQGSYYGQQMAKALEDRRIASVPHDEHALVETWWDLGIGDATVIWFVQRVGKEIHAIDYYEASGEPLSHYAKIVRDRGYDYSHHVLPHEARARELGTGQRRMDILSELGVEPEIAPKHMVDEGIEQVRALLGRAWFDSDKCFRGIEALRQYRKETLPEDQWGGRIPVYKDKPLHDWTSHAADAFRYGAVFRPPRSKQPAIVYPEPVGYYV